MSNVSDTFPVILTGVFGQYFVYGQGDSTFKVFHRPHGIPDTGDEFVWGVSDIVGVELWTVEQVDPATGATLIALKGVQGFDVYETSGSHTIAPHAYNEHRIHGKLVKSGLAKDAMWAFFGFDGVVGCRLRRD